MRSLQRRLTMAFVAVAVISIVAVVALTGAATRAEFERYFAQEREIGAGSSQQPGPPFPFWRHRARPGDPGMRMGRAMGAPEFRFLVQLRRASWLAVLAGVLAAIVLGAALARRVTAPLRLMAAAATRVGTGDLSGNVPVPPDEELATLAGAFNAMTADLRRLEEQRRQGAADIAHELRTPLAVLQANLEGMLDGVVEASPDRLAALHTQVRLLGRLVDDLRDLSLAQAGRLILHRTDCDLGALVTDAVAVVLPRAHEKGVAVRRALAAPIPHISADRDRLLQIIHNLLDNAVRHTPAGGEVVVELAASESHVTLAVRDTGAGIPADEIDRIFDRFHRIDPSRARASGGSGLGLAIVKSLADAHGGSVAVRSAAGEGSTFTVTLPIGT